MHKRSRSLLAAALFASLAPLAFADTSDAPLAQDPGRPAVGEWIGQVSWNNPIVAYGWRVDPDGTFSSGRLGRGLSGGGAWSANGAQLTLKYDDGFRYEGEVHGDAYNGTAYSAEGQEYGAFSMRRAVKGEGPIEEAP
ncbi:MAG: hypothetical protein WDM79_17610 [Terricaulis sp.]